MERRVLRYEVPVDDQWHRVMFADNSNVVHVGSRTAGIVEFWAVPPKEVEARNCAYEFRVFGTGHPIEDGSYVGSTYDLGGMAVWHLFTRKLALA